MYFYIHSILYVHDILSQGSVIDRHMYNLESNIEKIVFIVVCQSDLYMYKCWCGCVDDLLCCIIIFCDEEFRLVVQFWI